MSHFQKSSISRLLNLSEKDMLVYGKACWYLVICAKGMNTELTIKIERFRTKSIDVDTGVYLDFLHSLAIYFYWLYRTFLL